MEEEISHSPIRSNPVEVWKFSLDDIKGLVCTTQKVTILPFGTVNVHANTSVKAHCMRAHVLMEPTLGPQLPAAVVPTTTYRELRPGSSRVPICLHNLSAHTMEMPAKAVVGQVVPANQVPLVVHPTRTTEETNNKSPKGWVLEALDLQGLKKWPESEQKQARELLLKWEHLFVYSNLDLGKTVLIKHKIQLIDWMPFKEHYRCIAPHKYNNMRAHIQEMLDISAICKSHSPWPSAVVLVWKKDSGRGSVWTSGSSTTGLLRMHTGGSCLSRNFWEHEKKHYPAYPIIVISLIIQRNLQTKIRAKQESGLTTVRLKRDPPVLATPYWWNSS